MVILLFSISHSNPTTYHNMGQIILKVQYFDHTRHILAAGEEEVLCKLAEEKI